jgi:MoaA/NifB/PqqE/SkfB family radical SAM enzyme
LALLHLGGENMEKLLSVADLSKELDVTKQAVYKAVESGRIPEAKYKLGISKAWTNAQLEQIKKTYVKRNY